MSTFRTLNLLVEIGCEELPAKSLAAMTHALAQGLLGALDKLGIAHGASRVLYTPRRLSVVIDAVADEQPAQVLERRGPAQAGARLADGSPSPALRGFANSAGVSVELLELLATDKGAWYVHRQSKPGARTLSLLADVVATVLKGLPIAKPMRWGASAHAFLRPIHSVIVLLGTEIAPGEVFGIPVGRLSAGHRFHHPAPISIESAASYVAALAAARVLVDPVERRARVVAQVTQAAQTAGLSAKLDQDLVDEVSNLVEWPQAILCTFDADFLAVPEEALVLTMQQNQRFFALLNEQGGLSAQFVGVANIESLDPAQIRRGYERVIRPRFADAKFFFDADARTPLAGLRTLLEATVFQAKLGSIWQKSERVAALAQAYAPAFGVDAQLALRAAQLSKCDLMTRMVGEFPELQGTLGKRLALLQGEPAQVANALDEIYLPRFAGDGIAPSPLGRLLACCERADTLAGIWAVGMKPTGNKDPFALRRAGLGLARTLIEGAVEIDLLELLTRAAAQCAHAGTVDPQELATFVIERLRGFYAESGVDARVFDAVAALEVRVLKDFDSRIQAARAFAALPQAPALAAANKRIGNILKKLDGPAPSDIDPSALATAPEQALYAAWREAHLEVQTLAERREYSALLQRLSQLREPIDAFFESVMVMADDLRLRHNRLALLNALRVDFLRVADISLL